MSDQTHDEHISLQCPDWPGGDLLLDKTAMKSATQRLGGPIRQPRFRGGILCFFWPGRRHPLCAPALNYEGAMEWPQDAAFFIQGRPPPGVSYTVGGKRARDHHAGREPRCVSHAHH